MSPAFRKILGRGVAFLRRPNMFAAEDNIVARENGPDKNVVPHTHIRPACKSE
jgi:hypothetical protein